MKKLADGDVEGKAVLVRVDFNVPVDDGGKVRDDGRIVASLPTIRFLIGRKCRVILMSHLGRPKGKVVDSLKMDGVALRLSRLLKKDVKKLDDCVGRKVEAEIAGMKGGDVVLLENLRFHQEEEVNDSGFAKNLASIADVYVNDAFGASHRAHASVVAIAKFLPSYAGLLLEREISALSGLLKNPAKPFIAVLGGAKVSDKVKLIESLLKRVDRILVGGAMAFTFLKARGYDVGSSMVEDGLVATAKELLSRGKIVLPVDVAVADKFYASAERKVVDVGSIPEGWVGLDIGPETVKLFSGGLGKAKTIVWNGPLGVFEFDAFASGTVGVAKAIASSGGLTVIGGGDTITAARKAGVGGRFSHTSTGGGAMLEFLEGKKLPALAALGW